MANDRSTARVSALFGDAMTNANPAITVRRATPSDLPVVGRLGALLVRGHHDFDPQRFIPATPDTERGYAWFLGTQLEEPKTIVLVAEREGKVVGYTYSA